MDREISRLEEALLAGDDTGLARAALVASGIGTAGELDGYFVGIGGLYREIAGDISGDSNDLDRARGIFDWLWRGRPGRYESQGSFRLTEVIDAQAGGCEGVGNCLGLTMLYNVLAGEFGLDVRAAHLEQAFGRGPHVFTMLRIAGSTIDIENIMRDGFNYRGHCGIPGREEWADRQLVADVYHSVGNEFASSGEWERAIVEYEKAIRLYPGYVRAHLNKGIALVELGETEKAMIEFSRWAR